MDLKDWRKQLDRIDNEHFQTLTEVIIKSCPIGEQDNCKKALKKDIKIWKEKGCIPKSFKLCTKKYLDKIEG
jgi:hypothetical protein